MWLGVPIVREVTFLLIKGEQGSTWGLLPGGCCFLNGSLLGHGPLPTREGTAGWVHRGPVSSILQKGNMLLFPGCHPWTSKCSASASKEEDSNRQHLGIQTSGSQNTLLLLLPSSNPRPWSASVPPVPQDELVPGPLPSSIRIFRRWAEGLSSRSSCRTAGGCSGGAPPAARDLGVPGGRPPQLAPACTPGTACLKLTA